MRVGKKYYFCKLLTYSLAMLTPTRRISILTGLLLLIAGQAAAWELETGGLRYRPVGLDEVAVVPRIEAGRNTYRDTIVIPETVYRNDVTYRVTAIADSAFFGSDVAELQIPNSVTRIGRYAMANTFSLASVTLPMGLTEISEGALAGSDIESVALPEGVGYIGLGAFEDCLRLRTVMLPYTLRYIDDYAFDGCNNLFEIYCAAETPPLLGDDALPETAAALDLILADRRAANAWQADPYFDDHNRFSLWTNEDVTNPETIPVDTRNLAKLTLGQGLGWRVYAPSGELIAVTAADHYHLPVGQIPATYVVAATNLINEAEQATPITIHPPLAPIDPDGVARPDPVIIAIDGVIHIEGDNYGTWTRIYDVYGQLHYERPSVDGIVPGLQQGRVYIVVVGNYAKKIIL